MAANPLVVAHTSAGRLTDNLGVLFGRMGTAEHPNGRLLVAYRNARRALRGALAEGGQFPVAAAAEVMDGLRMSIETESRKLLEQAELLGEGAFHEQTAAYQARAVQPVTATRRTETALGAVLAEVDQQAKSTQAMLVSGVDEALVYGDEERQGVVQPAPVLRTLAEWLALVALGAFGDWATGEFMVGDKLITFQKQAIAALDGRTTDCCLRAHGQIVDLKADFHLTGYPRYADYLPNPPFHMWCRTAIALYLPNFDMGLTARMRDSARQILDERAAGLTGDRHPADAFA